MVVESPHIPDIQEIATLPRWAVVSFAARCSRRVQPLFGTTYKGHTNRQGDLSIIDDNISLAEISAALATRQDKYIPFAANTFNTIESWIKSSATGAYQSVYYQDRNTESAIRAAYRAAICSARARTAQYLEEEYGEFNYANMFDDHFVKGIPRDIYSAIRYDFNLLKEIADRERWNDSTPIPVNLFCLQPNPARPFELNKHHIIDVSTAINTRVIQQFCQFPDKIRTLTARQFEALIAELFCGFGFDVELTKSTRDGGADIVAVSRGIVEVKYLIECKKYTPPNKVGVKIIREIHGVAISKGATKGIVATTSHFTKDAIHHIQKHRYVLEGRDYRGIVEWLDRYDKRKEIWSSS